MGQVFALIMEGTAKEDTHAFHALSALTSSPDQLPRQVQQPQVKAVEPVDSQQFYQLTDKSNAAIDGRTHGLDIVSRSADQGPSRARDHELNQLPASGTVDHDAGRPGEIDLMLMGMDVMSKNIVPVAEKKPSGSAQVRD